MTAGSAWARALSALTLALAMTVTSCSGAPDDSTGDGAASQHASGTDMTNPRGQPDTAPGTGHEDRAARTPDGDAPAGGLGGADGSAGGGAGGPGDTALSGPGDGPPSESGPRGTAFPTSTAAALPGGTVGRDELADHGWLDAGGHLMLRSSAPAEARLGAAFCGFLFGTPHQVGTEALLADDVILDEASGYQPAADHAGSFRCLYDVGGTPTLALQVSDGPPVDATLPGHLIIVTDGDLQGVLSYSPGYAGDTMAERTARRWLEHAVDRTAPANP